MDEMKDGEGFPVNIPAKTTNVTGFRIYLEVTYLTEMDDDDSPEVWKWHVEVGPDSNDCYDKEFDSFDEAIKFVASFAKS